MVKNISMTYVTGIANIAAGVCMFPYVASRVGTEAYGAWLLLTSVTNLVMISDFGISTSMVKFVADANARNNDKVASEMASTGLFAFSILGTVAAFLYVLICNLLWSSFHIPQSEAPLGRDLVWITGGTILLLGLPGRSFIAVLAGMQYYDLSQTFLLIGLLIGTGYKLVSLAFSPTVINVAIGDALVAILPSLFSCLFIVRNIPNIKLRVGLINLRLLRSTIPFSMQVAFMSALSFIILQTDNIVISLTLTAGAITIYNAGFRIYSTVRKMCEYLMGPLLPKSAALQSRGDMQQIRADILWFSSVAVAVAWCIGMPVIIYANPLITLWVGKSFAEAQTITQILVGSFLVNSIHLVSNTYFAGIGKPARFSFLHSIWVVSNLLISVLLALHIGLVGVAIGTALPLCILEPFYVAIICKEFNLTCTEFLFKVIGPSLVSAVVGLLAMLGGSFLLRGASSVVKMFSGSIAFGVFFMVTFMIVGVCPAQREHFSKNIKTKLTIKKIL